MASPEGKKPIGTKKELAELDKREVGLKIERRVEGKRKRTEAIKGLTRRAGKAAERLGKYADDAVTWVRGGKEKIGIKERRAEIKKERKAEYKRLRAERKNRDQRKEAREIADSMARAKVQDEAEAENKKFDKAKSLAKWEKWGFTADGKSEEFDRIRLNQANAARTKWLMERVRQIRAERAELNLEEASRLEEINLRTGGKMELMEEFGKLKKTG